MSRWSANSDYDYAEEIGDPVGRSERSQKIDYSKLAIKKPESRKRTKGRQQRAARKVTMEVRPYVFARERNICRICRCRPTDSMHELRPRSLGGRISRRNSVAVCGSGTTGCHGYAQSKAIRYALVDAAAGAEAAITFTAMTQAAADWMRIKVGESIESAPMVQVEAEV